MVPVLSLRGLRSAGLFFSSHPPPFLSLSPAVPSSLHFYSLIHILRKPRGLACGFFLSFFFKKFFCVDWIWIWGRG